MQSYNSRNITRRKSPAKAITFGIIAFILVLVAIFGFTAKVPTGYTGILTTFGKVEDNTLEAGFHMKNITQSVVLMDNREQREEFSVQAFSKDIQQVDVQGSINYCINKDTAMTLYREVGTDYEIKLIIPRRDEAAKAVFTKYTAEELVEHRGELSAQIKDKLKSALEEYGISILAVSIQNIDFTDAFTNAVEEKQVALQTKLRVETEQAQQVSMEKSAAERKRISAEADAAVAKVQADANAYSRTVNATAEAEANKKIAASLTDALIDYWRIEKWNGSVPQVQSGSGIMPIIDMNPAGDVID